MELISVGSGLAWKFYWLWSFVVMNTKVVVLACLLSQARGVEAVTYKVSQGNPYVGRAPVADRSMEYRICFSCGDGSDRLSISGNEFLTRIVDGREFSVGDFADLKVPVGRVEEKTMATDLFKDAALESPFVRGHLYKFGILVIAKTKFRTNVFYVKRKGRHWEKYIYMGVINGSIVPSSECVYSSWEQHLVNIPTELWSHTGEATEFEYT